MLHAVIMAGGTGTRFWPKSRASAPEATPQHARPADDDPGHSRPARRPGAAGARVGGHNRAFGRGHRRPIAAIARNGDPRRAVQARYGAVRRAGRHWLLRSDPDATMVMMPADHVIADAEAFRAAVRYAAEPGRGAAGADRDLRHSPHVSGRDFRLHRAGRVVWPRLAQSSDRPRIA